MLLRSPLFLGNLGLSGIWELQSAARLPLCQAVLLFDLGERDF